MNDRDNYALFSLLTDVGMDLPIQLIEGWPDCIYNAIEYWASLRMLLLLGEPVEVPDLYQLLEAS